MESLKTQGFIQWSLDTIGESLIPTTISNYQNFATKNSFQNCLEASQSVDDENCNSKAENLATTFHMS